jgi:hypothetical protein
VDLIPPSDLEERSYALGLTFEERALSDDWLRQKLIGDGGHDERGRLEHQEHRDAA